MAQNPYQQGDVRQDLWRQRDDLYRQRQQLAPFSMFGSGQGQRQQGPSYGDLTKQMDDLSRRIANPLGDIQRGAADQFRQNMPATQQRIVGDLAKQNAIGLGDDLRTSRENMNRRGLSYGGMAKGEEAKLRAGRKQSLASGISKVNQGLIDTQNMLDQNAIKTGMSIQQNAQAMQDAIYARAMADQQSRDAALGGALSTIGTGVGMYLGSAGGPAGMAAGAQIGGAAGRSLY